MSLARRWLSVVTVAGLAGCGTQPAAAPTPPVVPANQPPTVTVTGGSCHPHPDRPCTVTLTATASDPDGEALTYAWGGCASGGGAASPCVLSSLGPSRAMVEVRDARGASAVASADVVGVNAAPRILYSDVPRGRLWINGVFFGEGSLQDPDGDEDLMRLCQGMQVTGTGSCRAERSACVRESGCGHAYCGPGVFFGIEIRTPPTGGACTVEAIAWDSWGERASVRLAFEVG